MSTAILNAVSSMGDRLGILDILGFYFSYFYNLFSFLAIYGAPLKTRVVTLCSFIIFMDRTYLYSEVNANIRLFSIRSPLQCSTAKQCTYTVSTHILAIYCCPVFPRSSHPIETSSQPGILLYRRVYKKNTLYSHKIATAPKYEATILPVQFEK